MNEADLQSQIIKKINDNGIYNLINDKEEYISIAHTSSNGDFQRFFSINYILREKYLCYSKMILEGLNSEIEIVNGTKIKNISLNHNEKLYPDIILYNYENSKYFILELKKSSKTEREAVTELLGYRLEIKNHLPLINNGDVPLIIVSTEFNTLLLHSVASLILDNIPVLCLKPIIIDGVFISFDIVDISIWSNIGIDSLSSQSFEGVTICLYGKSDNKIEIDDIYDDLYLAVDILKNDANQISSHGFCVVWENFNAKNISNQVSTDYFISIFTVNPYNIFYNDKNAPIKYDVLSEHINKTISETDAKFISNNSIELITQNTMKFLKNRYTPNYEMNIDFIMFQRYLVEHGVPLVCDAWGEVGNYIRGLYINPIMQNLIDRKRSGYQNPDVFFRLLGYLTKEYAFANGMDFCGDYLNFGIQLGDLLNLFNIYKDNNGNPYIKNKIRIDSRRIINSLYEVGLAFTSFPETIISIENAECSINSIENCCKWFLDQMDSIEYNAFKIGLQYYFCFNNIEAQYRNSYPELYTSFIQEIYPFIIDIFLDYLKKHKGVSKSNEIMDICVKIFYDFNLYSWESLSELENITKNIDINMLKKTLVATDDNFKFNFLINNTYVIFNTWKALSYCQKLNFDESMTLDDLLKLTDANWVVEQIKQLEIIHPNAAPLIHIQENERVSIEVSLDPADLILKRQLNKNQLILKTSNSGIDISVIKNYEEILKPSFPPLDKN